MLGKDVNNRKKILHNLQTQLDTINICLKETEVKVKEEQVQNDHEKQDVAKDNKSQKNYPRANFLECLHVEIISPCLLREDKSGL